MSCINCGHGKEMHDSDCDERMEKEWCNVDSCQCVHYSDEEAAQQSVQADKCHKSPSGEHQFNETIVASECVFCGTCR